MRGQIFPNVCPPSSSFWKPCRMKTCEKFKPHMTIVPVTQHDLKKMLDEKFEPLTFSPGGYLSATRHGSGEVPNSR